MSRLLTGSILAHEVMHAWLRLSGYPRLPPMVEEGLCQLMATLWLEQQPPEPEVGCSSFDVQQVTGACRVLMLQCIIHSCQPLA